MPPAPQRDASDGDESGTVSRLLRRISAGDRTAENDLIVALHDHLRRLAGAMLRGQVEGQSLSPTILLDEAFMRLVRHENHAWNGRSHFLSAAARAMRRLLVDTARARKRQKRGEARLRVDLDQAVLAYERRALDLLCLDEALGRLEEMDPTMARAIELRFFGGLSVSRAAEVLGLERRQLDRRLKATIAWLHGELA